VSGRLLGFLLELVVEARKEMREGQGKRIRKEHTWSRTCHVEARRDF
jgi:hypothetical protein